MLDLLHACPRKFQLVKAKARSGTSDRIGNIDFAFGHAVGSGVQAWLASKGNEDAAILNAMLAWRIDYTANLPKKGKSLTEAVLAVMKWPAFYETVLEDWEVLILPNGKPAIELSVSIDFENGFKHYCHIDVVLRNRITGQLAIQENKTTGFKSGEEAIYANSAQALSYSVLIDQLTDDTSYEVFYCVYSSTSREWELFPFAKTTSMKAEWLLDAQLDHAAIKTYYKLNFFPKRGESCYAFMRRCQFFGECNMTGDLPDMLELAKDEEAEAVDFAFTLSDIKRTQHERNATP